jgi:uncharacterized protein YcgL (UPF0745 family)
VSAAGFDKGAEGGRLVQVFRSKRKEGMYLIVDRAEGLARLPDTLLAKFGRPEPSLTFMLTPQRPMAQAQAPVVLAAIAERGYWLQMPPVDETEPDRQPVGPWQ